MTKSLTKIQVKANKTKESEFYILNMNNITAIKVRLILIGLSDFYPSFEVLYVSSSIPQRWRLWGKLIGRRLRRWRLMEEERPPTPPSDNSCTSTFIQFRPNTFRHVNHDLKVDLVQLHWKAFYLIKKCYLSNKRHVVDCGFFS